jgi:hypothetical protein
MYRLANGTQVPSLPAAPAPVGTPGYGTSGNPGAGLLGSIFGAAEFNTLQEELMSFLAAAGITPDRNNHAQVLAACTALFGGGGTLAANGWQRLPGGLILQWGSFGGTTGALVDGVAEHATILVTFPVAFPNACWRVYGIAHDVSGACLQEHAWHSGAPSLTSVMMGLSCRQTATAMTGSYLAIGR